MELPEKLVNKFKELEEKEQARENKVKSRLMYNRRKLDRDVRKYIRNSNPIRFRNIEAIGRQHRFYIGESLFREDQSSHENA